jgi:hypothetical protein
MLAIVAILAYAQSTRPSFEVASVEPSKSANTRSTISGGARFGATAVTLQALVQFADSDENLFLSSDRIIGGPAIPLLG